MKTVLHASLYSRFIETRIQGSNFLRDRLAYGDNVRAPVQFRRERLCLFSKTDPSIFTSTAPVLLDHSN